MSYGIYQPNNQAPAPIRRSLDDVGGSLYADDTKGAAVAVAVMIVGCALFLTVLKRSGFRAMVAVGRS